MMLDAGLKVHRMMLGSSACRGFRRTRVCSESVEIEGPLALVLQGRPIDADLGSVAHDSAGLDDCCADCAEAAESAELWMSEMRMLERVHRRTQAVSARQLAREKKTKPKNGSMLWTLLLNHLKRRCKTCWWLLQGAFCSGARRRQDAKGIRRVGEGPLQPGRLRGRRAANALQHGEVPQGPRVNA